MSRRVRTKIVSLAGDSLVYGLGQAATKSIYMLLVPLLTHAFSTAQYGLTEISNLLVTLTYSLALLGLDSAYPYFYYRSEEAERRRVSVTVVTARLCFTLGGAACMWFAAPAAGHLLRLDAGGVDLLRLAALTLPGAAGVAAIQDVLRVTFRPSAYGLLTASNMLTTLGCTAYLIGVRHFGPRGVFLARIAADGCTVLAGVWVVRAELRARLSSQVLTAAVRFGLPLVATTLSYALVASADRYILEHAAGLEVVGVYSLAAKLAGVVVFAVSAFQLAWGPFCYAMAGHEDARSTMARVTHLYFLGAGLLATALSLFAPEILRIAVPRSYWGAQSVVPLLAFGNAVYGGYFVAAMAVNMAGKTAHLGWTALLGAAVAIALSWHLVGDYGSAGVAWGTLVGYVISVATVSVMARRVYPLPIRWGSVAAFLVACGVACVAIRPLAGWNAIAQVALKCALLVVLVAAGFAARLTKTNDVREALRAVDRLRARAAT